MPSPLRTLARLTALLLLLGLVAAPPVSADPNLDPGAGTSGPGVVSADDPAAALDQAQQALSGSGDVDASLALAKLQSAYGRLSDGEKEQAALLLSRPTDKGEGMTKYSAPEAKPVCGEHVCVHYVRRSADAPPKTDADRDGVPDWAQRTLAVLENVWAAEIGRLGFRPPATDGERGGDRRFDVYLADVGTQGIYGYCAPEGHVEGEDYQAFGFCVLDDDFRGFSLPPAKSLRVTAAHEFFHAIQFGYDYVEDGWLMEATATWMEEQVADSVDDNRQFLPAGQLGNPATPLDGFSASGNQYGNWVFFQKLSETYGVDAVRRVWERLDAGEGAPDDYSTQAIAAFLRSKGSTFRTFYAAFAAGNLTPARAYAEGARFPRTPLGPGRTLDAGKRAATDTLTLEHLTSRTVHFRPGPDARRLRVRVTAPPLRTASAARLVVFGRDGSVVRRPIRLSGAGDGTGSVSFDAARVARVNLVLVNASTRMTCWHQRTAACQGIADDDGGRFGYRASAV